MEALKPLEGGGGGGAGGERSAMYFPVTHSEMHKRHKIRQLPSARLTRHSGDEAGRPVMIELPSNLLCENCLQLGRL